MDNLLGLLIIDQYMKWGLLAENDITSSAYVCVCVCEEGGGND